MSEQQRKDYLKIEQAIVFLQGHFREQPSLGDVASAINMSEFHCQRLFKAWAGVSPKKFTQYLSLAFAKRLLDSEDLPLLDVALETGLSGTGRLHDLFVNIEGMSPGEYKSGGKNLAINYQSASSPFGTVMIASTAKGVCHISFEEDEEVSIEQLRSCFPLAELRGQTDNFQQSALQVLNGNWQNLETIKVHLAGSPFQLKVWESLLTIPFGRLASYGEIASQIGAPDASRAVGTAIGANPIAYLIPCHRVVRKSGEMGGYRWGETRKWAINAWEAAKIEQLAV